MSSEKVNTKITEKEAKKNHLKVPRIFNGSALFRAKIDYEVLDFMSKQLPLNEGKLIARISVLYHHSSKWCRKKIVHLLSMGLIEYEDKGVFYSSTIHATDTFEKYLKDLKRNIRRYERIVQKEKEETERMIQENQERYAKYFEGIEQK